MTREQFEQYLSSHGWTIDRWGHYHKLNCRMKLQARSVRLEKSYQTTETKYMKSEKRWLPLRSAFYSKLSISENDKIAGMT